jgi:hypothetical protein
MTTTTTQIVSGRKGKRTLVSLAAIALFIGVSSGLVYSQGLNFESTEASAAQSEAWDRMTAPASRKVRCIMPEAWRRHCEL